MTKGVIDKRRMVILHFTGPLDNLGTGIVDYCSKLVDAQRRRGENAYHVISNCLANQGTLKDEKYIVVNTWGSITENEKQLEEIEQRFSDSEVVWYVHLAPPFCGTIVSPEWLKERVVVGRVHECKIPEKFKDLKTKERAQIKFNTVVEYVRTFTSYIVSNAEEIERLEQEEVSILNVTQSVPPNLDPRISGYEITKVDRSDVLVHFGMIRGKKGIEKVLEVQRIFDAQVESVKINTILSGSVSFGEYNTFIDVVTQIYDRQEAEIVLEATEFRGLFDSNADRERFASQASRIVSLLNQKKVRKLIGMEFYPNANEEKVFELLARSKVAYLPFDRGATFHSGSLPTCILSDIAVVTTATNETPMEYKQNLCIAVSVTEASRKIRELIENPQLLQEQLRKQEILKSFYLTWEEVTKDSINMIHNATMIYQKNKQQREKEVVFKDISKTQPDEEDEL